MKPEAHLLENTKKIKEWQKQIGKGPWTNEIFYGEYGEEEIIFMIIRHPSKLYWQGFAGVRKDHPLYKDKKWDVGVHGGITMRGFRDSMITSDYDHPEDRIWWFGFSCNKETDYIPTVAYECQQMKTKIREGSSKIEDYKTQDFVTEEARSLARHLLAVLLEEKKFPESML